MHCAAVLGATAETAAPGCTGCTKTLLGLFTLAHLLYRIFTGNPCASVNSPGDKYGGVKFERLTGIEAPAETPCQS